MRVAFFFSACFALAAAKVLSRSKRQAPVPHEVSVETNQNTILVKWRFANMQSGITSTIKWRKRGDPAWQELRTQMLQASLTGLEWGQHYELQVVARARDGQTASSTLMEVPVAQKPQQIAVQPSNSIPIPRNFRALVVTPNTCLLHWEPTKLGTTDCTYQVTMTPEGSRQGLVMQHSMNMAKVGSLEAGKTYNLQVQSFCNGQLSYPSSARLTFPRFGEAVMKPDTIEMRSVQGRSRSMTILWKMPAGSERNIATYTVYYSPNQHATKWESRRISGQTSEILLDNLEADQEYFIRIESEFRDRRSPTSSPTFKFKTPQLSVIENIKVIYGTDSSMRIEWVYFPHVNLADVEGVQVLYSKDKNVPENQWRQLEARRGENGVQLPETVQGDQRYFIRLNPRIRGKGLLKGTTTFQISTKPQVQRPQASNTMSNFRILPGTGNQITLQFDLPQSNSARIASYSVLYSYDRNAPQHRWMSVGLSANANSRSATINGLDLRRTIYFAVTPRTQTGTELQSVIYEMAPSQMTGASRQNRAIKTTTYVLNQKCLRPCTLSNGSSQGCGNTEVCVEDCGTGHGCGRGVCMERTLLIAAQRTRA